MTSWLFNGPTRLLHATMPRVSDHHIQILMLIVQAAALIGLLIYCVETHKIRKASQTQVELSQRLFKTSMDQVEALSRPCITFLAELRDGADAILEMHGAAGSLVARPDQGSYVIHNIGNGVALNLKYYITRGILEFDRPNIRTMRYMPAIPATARVALVETVANYNAEHDATFEYESIGRRKYRSTMKLNHRVITAFSFEEITDQ
jgi:hypothetical protein